MQLLLIASKPTFSARRLRMQSCHRLARHMLWVFDPQTHDSADKEEEDDDYRDAAVVCILTDSNGYDSDKGDDGKTGAPGNGSLLVAVVMIATSVSDLRC